MAAPAVAGALNRADAIAIGDALEDALGQRRKYFLKKSPPIPLHCLFPVRQRFILTESYQGYGQYLDELGAISLQELADHGSFYSLMEKGFYVWEGINVINSTMSGLLIWQLAVPLAWDQKNDLKWY